MSNPRTPVAPVIRFVRSIPGEYLTLAEVARTLRIPEPSLRKWRREDSPRFGPSLMTHYGKIPIYLYSLDDLERVRKAVMKRRTEVVKNIGRPRRWSVPEQRDRQYRQSREWRYKQRAKKMDGLGRRKEAAVWRGKAKEIRRGLDQQSREREHALR